LDLVCSAGTDENETISIFLALQSSPRTFYSMHVTQYIGGAVTKKLTKIINCSE